MPPPETANLKQYAVLWAAVGLDKHGQTTLASPVEIKCRWEETNTEAVSSQSDVVGNAVTVHVDRDIPINSELWLGRLEDLVGTASPGDICVVTSVAKVPDLKGRYFKRTVTLIKKGDTLSALA